jgi:hypothetical protein
MPADKATLMRARECASLLLDCLPSNYWWLDSLHHELDTERIEHITAYLVGWWEAWLDSAGDGRSAIEAVRTDLAARRGSTAQIGRWSASSASLLILEHCRRLHSAIPADLLEPLLRMRLALPASLPSPSWGLPLRRSAWPRPHAAWNLVTAVLVEGRKGGALTPDALAAAGWCELPGSGHGEGGALTPDALAQIRAEAIQLGRSVESNWQFQVRLLPLIDGSDHQLLHAELELEYATLIDPAPQPPPMGPQAPSSFVWTGGVVQNLTSLEYQILERLWGGGMMIPLRRKALAKWYAELPRARQIAPDGVEAFEKRLQAAADKVLKARVGLQIYPDNGYLSLRDCSATGAASRTGQK